MQKFKQILISDGGRIVEETEFALTLDDLINAIRIKNKSINQCFDKDTIRLAKLFYKWNEENKNNLLENFNEDKFTDICDSCEDVLNVSDCQYLLMHKSFRTLGYDIETDETFFEQVVLAFLGFDVCICR